VGGILGELKREEDAKGEAAPWGEYWVLRNSN